MTNTKSSGVTHLAPARVLGAHWIEGMTVPGKADNLRVASVKIGALKEGKIKAMIDPASVRRSSVKISGTKPGIIKKD